MSSAVKAATPPPEQTVAADNFAVVAEDVTLVAYLTGAFALCIYDAVQESGALVHLRIVPPGRANDPNLTDTTLATDLLLLDRCVNDLREIEPRAQYWQAKLVAHVPDTTVAKDRFQAMHGFLEAFLRDAKVKLISVDQHAGNAMVVRFRPSMGNLRAEVLAPPSV
jgi:chemotaxis receptor (MCP) glutamine deamidase CheD